MLNDSTSIYVKSGKLVDLKDCCRGAESDPKLTLKKTTSNYNDDFL